MFVYTRCSKLGTKSFDLSWIITKATADSEVLAAEGKTVIVCFDYESKKATEIPFGRRKQIERFEEAGLSGENAR